MYHSLLSLHCTNINEGHQWILLASSQRLLQCCWELSELRALPVASLESISLIWIIQHDSNLPCDFCISQFSLAYSLMVALLEVTGKEVGLILILLSWRVLLSKTHQKHLRDHPPCSELCLYNQTGSQQCLLRLWLAPREFLELQAGAVGRGTGVIQWAQRIWERHLW